VRRFFVDPSKIAGSRALVTGSEAKHLVSVLRLGVGAQVQLFDGTGTTYQAEISTLSKGCVEFIISSRDEPAEMKARLFLGQALLKGKKMDMVIQKTTELGVAGLYPFFSEYVSVADESGDRAERRLERWQKISREACKQCNFPTPPSIFPVSGFDKMLEETVQLRCEVKLIFWEDEKNQGLQKVIGDFPFSSAMILIGPEGGFSVAEVKKAESAGFRPVTLGRRILRAETAAIASTAIMQYLSGNLDH
jgi:16S rRNA (uracil1498-N3)-methyltransferase